MVRNISNEIFIYSFIYSRITKVYTLDNTNISCLALYPDVNTSLSIWLLSAYKSKLGQENPHYTPVEMFRTV